MRVIDSWTGGSSPYARYRYRLVELSLHEYRVEVAPLNGDNNNDSHSDSNYQPITRGSRHVVALRIGELLRLEYESGKERQIKQIKMVASA